MATTCYLKWPADLKLAATSSKIGAAASRHASEHTRQVHEQAAEQAADDLRARAAGSEQLQHLVEEAIRLLPTPIVGLNSTLTNPFVRVKVYELAAGEPEE